MRTFRKSAGTLCTAPDEIAFLVMDFILHRYAIGRKYQASCVCSAEAMSDDWDDFRVGLFIRSTPGILRRERGCQSGREPA
jgi:hypothetical protein